VVGTGRAQSLGDGPVVTRRSHVTDGVPDLIRSKAHIVKLRYAPPRHDEVRDVLSPGGSSISASLSAEAAAGTRYKRACERGCLKNPRCKPPRFNDHHAPALIGLL
jgi:hypothetical protein